MGISNGGRPNRHPLEIFYHRLMRPDTDAAVAELYRSDWGRIVATLIRLVGDFEIAEEAAQEAFTAAVNQWRNDGVPEFPRAWIIQTARHKAIDLHPPPDAVAGEGCARTPRELDQTIDAPGIRRRRNPRRSSSPDLHLLPPGARARGAGRADAADARRPGDGRDRPRVPGPARDDGAASGPRQAQDPRRPHSLRRCPARSEMPERLDAVLTVIYLIFNEGYAATRGGPLVRAELCAEAIRLARLVRTLLAPQPPAEATGLLALMLLHDSRRDARLDAAGDIVMLDEQDRSRWDQRQIAEALPLVEEAFRGGPGPIAVQASIAALHCQAARPEDTDWPQILRLYDFLERLQPSPIVSLNRAVAVAMVRGAAAGSGADR